MVNLMRRSTGATDQKNDDKDEVESIDLTPDANALQVLQIKPPKKGEALNDLDAEKVYRYQLEKDIVKLKEKKGSYATKALNYMFERYADPSFAKVALSTSKIGQECATEEVAQVTREISWRATSRPEGVIAHKRFQEWMAGTPKGPSQAFIKDKEQRKMDNALWENIKYDRLRKSKKQERIERKQRAEAYAAQKKEEADRLAAEKEALRLGQKLDSKADIAAGAVKRENIQNNKFADNRIVPSEGGLAWSRKDWNKGHHFNDELGNLERHFPVRTLVMKEGIRANCEVVKVADDETWFEPEPPSTLKYIKPGDNAEWAFVSFIMEKNVLRAEEFLKERARAKREYARKLEREKRAEERRLEKVMAAAKERQERIAAGLEVEEEEKDSDGDEGEEQEEEEEEEEEKEEDERGGGGEEHEEGADGVTGTANAPDSEGANEGLGNKTSLDAEGNLIIEADAGGSPLNEKKRKEKKEKKKKMKKKKDEEVIDDGPRPSCSEKTREIAQELAQRAGVALKAGLKDLARRGKIQARRSWSLAKLVVKHGRDFRDHLHTLTDDGRIEMPQPPAEPVQEPWEVPSGHELRLTRSERKHLEKLKRKILEERRIQWEEENSEDAIQARMLAEKSAKDSKKFSFARLWQDMVAFATGTVPEYKKSKAQKFMEERAKQAAAELKAEEDNASAMDLLFTIREKQRQAEAWLRDLKELFYGSAAADAAEEFQVDDLIREARAGNVNAVIDLLDHEMYPIGPNDVSQDGVSAFFVCLAMILNNEGADVSTDLIDLTIFQRIMRWFNKKASEAKLDLTVRLLMRRGGDINFRKQERDGDGLAIVHMAAENGAVKMLQWLHKKKANINLLSLNLKRTSLMLACRADKLEVVMFLLRNGGMLVINEHDANGWTALHFAASFASSELAMVLMLCGAKINARNSRGLLAVEECQARGRMEMMETLRTFKDKSIDHLDRLAYVSDYFPLPEFGKKLKSIPEQGSIAEESDS